MATWYYEAVLVDCSLLTRNCLAKDSDLYGCSGNCVIFNLGLSSSGRTFLFTSGILVFSSRLIPTTSKRIRTKCMLLLPPAMQRRESAVAACGRNCADRPQSARGHSRCAILSSQLCDRLAAMKLLPDWIFGWSTFEIWNRFLDFHTWNGKHSDFNYSVVKLWIKNNKKCENLKKLKMFAKYHVAFLKYDEICFLSQKLTKLQWIWQNVVQSTTNMYKRFFKHGRILEGRKEMNLELPKRWTLGLKSQKSALYSRKRASENLEKWTIKTSPLVIAAQPIIQPVLQRVAATLKDACGQVCSQLCNLGVVRPAVQQAGRSRLWEVWQPTLSRDAACLHFHVE